MISQLLQRPGDVRLLQLNSRPPTRLRQRLRSRVQFREVLAVTTVKTDNSVDDESRNSRRRSASPKSRMKAVAEKVSAARELARKLAEEKQAAIKTGQQFNERVLKSTEAAAMEAAIQAAEADSLNRALRSSELGRQKDAELRYLKKLNKALTQMVLEIATDKVDAERRLNSLLAEFQDSDLTLEEEVSLDLKEEEIVEVYTQLAVAAEEVKEVENLQQSCQLALETGSRFFTLPPQPIAGQSFRCLYNRLAGPLPESQELCLKYGVNKWEEIKEVEMKRSEALKDNQGEWWEVEFTLQSLLYRCDFVVFDQASGLVDNNDSKDFKLPIKGGLTKAQWLEKRLELFEENENQRNEQFQLEIETLTQEAETKAQIAIKEAKSRLQKDWEDDLFEQAQTLVQEQRNEALKCLNQAEETLRGPQVSWFGSMTPGSVATLAYNTSMGPLEGSQIIRVHLGVDNWYKEEITVLDLKPLSNEDLDRHQIIKDCGQGIWHGVKFRIPENAAVFNFVFDDGKSLKWDNHDGKDYLTPISDPLNEDQLIEIRKSQLKQELQSDLEKQLNDVEVTIKQRIMSKVNSVFFLNFSVFLFS